MPARDSTAAAALPPTIVWPHALATPTKPLRRHCGPAAAALAQCSDMMKVARGAVGSSDVAAFSVCSLEARLQQRATGHTCICGLRTTVRQSRTRVLAGDLPGAVHAQRLRPAAQASALVQWPGCDFQALQAPYAGGTRACDHSRAGGMCCRPACCRLLPQDHGSSHRHHHKQQLLPPAAVMAAKWGVALWRRVLLLRTHQAIAPSALHCDGHIKALR